jgi:hypothetical protein
MRPKLAEGKIAAKNGYPRETERVSQLGKQWRLAIRSGAVRQDQAIRAGVRWKMQVSANGRILFG